MTDKMRLLFQQMKTSSVFLAEAQATLDKMVSEPEPLSTSGLSLYHASNRQSFANRHNPNNIVVWLVPTERAELWFEWDSEHGGDCSCIEAEGGWNKGSPKFVEAYQWLVCKAALYFNKDNTKELILIPLLKPLTEEELKHLEQMKRDQEYDDAQDLHNLVQDPMEDEEDETFDPDEAEVVDEGEGYWLSSASDAEFDSNALASAGYGTDEDYRDLIDLDR